MKGMESGITLSGRKGDVLFSVLVLLGYVVARFCSVALHELAGHALFGELLGGTFYAFYLSPGIGFTSVHLPYTSPLWAEIVLDLSGILVELVAGVLLLLLLYPRLKGFLSRLVALLFAEVLLVHSFLYLGFGSLNLTMGDTYLIGTLLPQTLLPGSVRLLAVGLSLGTVCAVIISKYLLKLLQDHFFITSRLVAVRLLLLFWMVPLAMGVLSGAVLFPIVPFDLILYMLLFTAAGTLIYVLASTLVARSGVYRATFHRFKLKQLSSLLISFSLVLTVWVVGFGLTPGRAHGIQVADPPPEVERRFIEVIAVNVVVHLREEGSPLVEMRMKGFAEPESPLMQGIWKSFEKRPDWQFYETLSQGLAHSVFNVTRWRVVERDIVETIWYEGEEYPNARRVFLSVDPDLSTVLVENLNGSMRMTIIDPFVFYEKEEGFLDSINITWEDGVEILNVTVGGSGIAPQQGENFIVWRNVQRTDAHTHYTIDYRIRE